jgi:hypothetical protein
LNIRYQGLENFLEFTTFENEESYSILSEKFIAENIKLNQTELKLAKTTEQYELCKAALELTEANYLKCIMPATALNGSIFAQEG